MTTRGASEGSAALIVRNTLVSGLGSVAAVLAPLLLTPLLIDGLGAEAYAVWVFATTLTLSAGYLSLADLGAQQATVRFIAEARSSGDVQRANEFYSTSFALFLAIAVVVTPVLALASRAIVDLLGVHPAIADHATLAFQLIALSLLFDLPSLAFRSALEGAQHYVAIRLIDLIRITVVAAGSVAAILLDYGLVALAVVNLVAAVSACAATAVAVPLVVSGSSLSRRHVARRHLRSLLTFSGALFTLRLVSVVYRQMDRVIIAIVLGVVLVTRYEIANKVQAAVGVVLAISSSALLPAAAFIRVDTHRLKELFLRGTSYTVALTVPIAVAAILFAHPLVTGWVGDEWEPAVGLTRLFLVWMLLNAATTVGWSILVAMGRLRPIVLLNVAWMILNLFLSLLLVHPLGVAGVIWGTVISSAVLTVAYTRLYLSELDVRLAEWVRRVIVPNLPGAAVQLAVGLPLVALVDDLPTALLAGAGCSAASLVTYFFLGLRAPERRNLVETLASASGLRRMRA